MRSSSSKSSSRSSRNRRRRQRPRQLLLLPVPRASCGLTSMHLSPSWRCCLSHESTGRLRPGWPGGATGSTTAAILTGGSSSSASSHSSSQRSRRSSRAAAAVVLLAGAAGEEGARQEQGEAGVAAAAVVRAGVRVASCVGLMLPGTRRCRRHEQLPGCCWWWGRQVGLVCCVVVEVSDTGEVVLLAMSLCCWSNCKVHAAGCRYLTRVAPWLCFPHPYHASSCPNCCLPVSTPPPPLPAGTGKTTLAHVIARHCGFRVVEVNASDARTAPALTRAVTDAAEMAPVLDGEQQQQPWR
jgi:hypothetical protein